MPQRELVDFGKLTKREFPLINKLDRNQEDMVRKLFKYQRVMVDAVAGSGKTTVLTQAMKVLLDKGHIKSIYYVLFPVQEGSLGFLPGGVSEKISEYAVPFYQALVNAGVPPHSINIEDMCDPYSYGLYKIVPHTFLRGRTIEDVGILIDEAQNGTVGELKKTLTRITDSCYVGIAGHTGQIDIKKGQSGFSEYLHHFKRGVETGEFTDMGFASLDVDYRGGFSRYADKINENFRRS
jgi:PhoH-like ATPase